MNTPSPVNAAPTLSPAKAARVAAWNEYQIALAAAGEVWDQIVDLLAAGQREAAEAFTPRWRELNAVETAAWKRFCDLDTHSA